MVTNRITEFYEAADNDGRLKACKIVEADMARTEEEIKTALKASKSDQKKIRASALLELQRLEEQAKILHRVADRLIKETR